MCGKENNANVQNDEISNYENVEKLVLFKLIVFVVSLFLITHFSVPSTFSHLVIMFTVPCHLERFHFFTSTLGVKVPTFDTRKS